MGECRLSEFALAEEALPALSKGMLCMADRLFLCCRLWTKARANGADLLWRASKSFPLPCFERLSDGSYRSVLYHNTSDRRHGRNGVPVRVIEYQLPGVAKAEPLYRLVTSILDPDQAPAQELAPLYHDRWELETALDELKTHLRGPRIVLRSKTPDLVRQEFYGLVLKHFAIRGLMHEAALRADQDPERLSFTHTVRILRRRLPQSGAIPPSAVNEILERRAASSRGLRKRRGVKRNRTKFPVIRIRARPERPNYSPVISISQVKSIWLKSCPDTERGPWAAKRD